MSEIKIGVITASDRASAGIYEDISGVAIQDTMKEYLSSEFEIVYRCIPDVQDEIENTLIDLCDKEGCCLVVTTGGTGPALRDVTPEATENVCEKRLLGFGELMRQEGLKFVRKALLSRKTAGIRGTQIIINFPGKHKSFRKC